ncbi:MAG: bifunctional 4'-phosphopantothenoylcysteine decarboxylase/phosphopantothenoylcysteine synthetase, partial [Gemmatimonadetes bacterium]|nr:bifunctional 4'-phosphopantothenoylcysteine decarboxylase/phosphopantothenoylcysteine synthetase [Gemmatimonadota bacterium]
DATDPLAGFDVDTNVATLVWREGDPEALPTMTKHELAERILQSVAALLGAGG